MTQLEAKEPSELSSEDEILFAPPVLVKVKETAAAHLEALLQTSENECENPSLRKAGRHVELYRIHLVSTAGSLKAAFVTLYFILSWQ